MIDTNTFPSHQRLWQLFNDNHFKAVWPWDVASIGEVFVSLFLSPSLSFLFSFSFSLSLSLARSLSGKTGVTADRDKIEFRLFNSSSIFNLTLREELFSLPKQN